MKKILHTLLVSLACFALIAPAQSQDDGDAEFLALMAQAEMGPKTIALGSEATLQLPANDNIAFFGKEPANNLMEKRGSGASPERYGIIINAADEWFADIQHGDTGHIKDDDAEDIKADKLMKLIKDGEKKENESRRKRGVTELHVDGWAQEPHYDRANHRLIWALNVHSGNDPQTIINYSIIALGRKDIIAITLADSNNNLEKTQKSANELLNTITFNPGNRYEDYNPKTDKTAEYGLTALIVGAAAAKKFGLIAVIIAFIAKFSKIIIVAVAGGLYAMKKIFSRRRHDDDDDD
jgi:hypothetical protein